MKLASSLSTSNLISDRLTHRPNPDDLFLTPGSCRVGDQGTHDTDEEETVQCNTREFEEKLILEASIDVDFSISPEEEEDTVERPIDQSMILHLSSDNSCAPQSSPTADEENTVQYNIDEEDTALVPNEQTEKTVQAYLEEVDFYLQNKLYRDAAELTRDTLKRKPNHPILLDKLALINNHQDRHDSQFPTLPKKGITKHKETFMNNVKSHRQKGIYHWKNGNTDGAIREFENALKSEKKLVFCHKMLAVCYAKKKRISYAIKHFKLGLHCDDISLGEQIALYFKLGRCYEYLKNEDEALYYYSKVMWHSPEYRDVRDRIHSLEQTKSNSVSSE